MEGRSAYVIATWGGPRRVEDKLYAKDRTIYIRHHLAQLETLRHELDLVIIAVPRDESQDYEFFDWLREEVQEKVGSARVEVFWRDNNQGLAFGSFEEAFLRYQERESIDWWYWFEDDYVPLLDRFDFQMRRVWEESKDPSFVAARISHHDTQGMPHAIISIGMTSTEKINQVRELHGGLVYLKEDSSDYANHETYMSQRKFTNTFAQVGRLYDVTQRYAVGLRLKRGPCSWYGRGGAKIIGPIHHLRPWHGGRYPTPEGYR